MGEWRGIEEEAQAWFVAEYGLPPTDSEDHADVARQVALLRRAVAHGYRLGVREHGAWYSTEERADAIEAGDADA